GEVYPIVERGQELGIDTKIDAVDGPAIAEADEAYERWVAKEIACGKADEDVRMGKETAQAVGEQDVSVMVLVATEKMLHVEVVAWLVRKMVAESEDKDELKIIVLPSSILHKLHVQWLHTDEAKVREVDVGHRKESTGRRIAQASRTTKAGPSKRAVDNDKVEVVESHTHVKGNAPVHSRLDAKVVANLSQSLRLLCAEATYLRLQVCIDQLAKALEKIGVE
ncbi:hypothetical protein M404DRAFT_26193, partial [Pisolithus tinctorius Marx 270]